MKKSKLKRFIKGCFSISVFSIAGCIALSAQAQNSYASQQMLGPGGMQSQNIKQLLSEINGNILGLKQSSNSLLDVQKKATSTGVGYLFNHTTNIVPAAPIVRSSNNYNNSSYPQMNLNLDKSVSLSKLGDDIGANKNPDNSSNQGGGDYNKQPNFNNLVADTYCSKKLDDINHNTPSFISWALSAPNSISSQNNQPSLMSDPICLNYIYKLKNNIYKDYTQNSYNNNFASAASANQPSNIDSAYYNAKNMTLSQDSVNGSSQGSFGASLTDALSNQVQGSDPQNLQSSCSNWIQEAVARPGFKESQIPNLKVAYLICKKVIKISSSQNDQKNKSDSSLVHGLLKAQLNKEYFDNLKGANAVQIARINALNNIISNYLANQRNEKLKEIEQQNNVLLLAQAANLVK